MNKVDRQIAALRRMYGVAAPVPPAQQPRLREVLRVLRRSLHQLELCVGMEGGK